MGESVRQLAVVGEQQQPLAVLIQPAGRFEPGDRDIVRTAWAGLPGR